MLTSLMAKIAAGFAAVAGVFFMIIRYQTNKIGNLEHENKTIHKKSEMQSESAVFVAETITKEQDEVLEMTKEINKNEKPSLDDINSL